MPCPSGKPLPQRAEIPHFVRMTASKAALSARRRGLSRAERADCPGVTANPGPGTDREGQSPGPAPSAQPVQGR